MTELEGRPVSNNAKNSARVASTYSGEPNDKTQVTMLTWEAHLRAHLSDPDRFLFRLALPTDYDDVLECAKDAILSIDFLPAYYHRFFTEPNRKCGVLVDKTTGKAVCFSAVNVVDDGHTAVLCAERTHVDFRSQGLCQMLLTQLLKLVRLQYPNCKQALADTLNDTHVLKPRYYANLQINKLLGALRCFGVSCKLQDLHSVTSNIQHSGNISVVRFPYKYTYLLATGSHKLAKHLLSDQYVMNDFEGFRLQCKQNFSDDNVFNTTVYVGSTTTDLSALEDCEDEPDAALLAQVDSLSFIRTHPTPSGPLLKSFMYADCADSVLGHFKKCVLDSSEHLQDLGKSQDAAQYMKHSDRAVFAMFFPLCVNYREVRSRLYGAGYGEALSGPDFLIAFLYRDELFSRILYDGK